MGLPKWLLLVQTLAPAILSSFGVPRELTSTIVDGIQDAEALPGATGPDKKQHVLSIVGDAVAAINTAQGRRSLDPSRVQALASAAINTVVEAVDLVHDRTTEPNQLNVPAPSNVEPAIPPSTASTATTASIATFATTVDGTTEPASAGDPTAPTPSKAAALKSRKG